ncbi:MAG: LytTR family transcriptional regulator [Proteobacteria bacterium]|nr:LytTR family transcriptional regulator [Pseudomonadota bacterium]
MNDQLDIPIPEIAEDQGSYPEVEKQLSYYRDFLGSHVDMSMKMFTIFNYLFGLGLLVATIEYFFVLEYFIPVQNDTIRITRSIQIGITFGLGSWLVDWTALQFHPKILGQYKGTIFAYLLTSALGYLLCSLGYGLSSVLLKEDFNGTFYLVECFMAAHIWILNLLLTLHQKSRQQLSYDFKMVEEINMSLIQRLQKLRIGADLIISRESQDQGLGQAVKQTHDRESQSITVSNSGTTEVIKVDEVSHISSEGNYCRIFLVRGNQSHEIYVRMTMKKASEKFPSDQFIQIHRSHIINFKHIIKIKKGQKWQIHLAPHGEQILPISRNRLPMILPIVKNHLNQEKLNQVFPIH